MLLLPSVLDAGVCFRLGSEDLCLESFSLMLLMSLDMVAVAIESEECWFGAKVWSRSYIRGSVDDVPASEFYLNSNLINDVVVQYTSFWSQNA